jgi:Family of unknown function (DUF5947)
VTRPQGLRRFTGSPGSGRTAPGADGAPAPAQPPGTGPAETLGGSAGAPPGGAGAEPGPPVPDTDRQAKLPEEHCEFCAAAIPATHGHVADLEQSSLMCACRACYLLFTHPGASSLSRSAGQEAPADRPAAGAHGRYHAVPDRYLRDSSRVMSAAEWDELQIPVGLAFFLYRSQPGELGCFYPSPAGATECALDLPAWQRLAEAHPLLAGAAPDVEAVLICRPGAGPGGRPPRPPQSALPAEAAPAEAGPAEAPATMDYFIVPIDACYELAGRMRMLWRGFDGGTEARESIDEFLASVRARAKDTARQGAQHG